MPGLAAMPGLEAFHRNFSPLSWIMTMARPTVSSFRSTTQMTVMLANCFKDRHRCLRMSSEQFVTRDFRSGDSGNGLASDCTTGDERFFPLINSKSHLFQGISTTNETFQRLEEKECAK